ncbi:eCIS core domain-containing protein [Acidisoma cladoniae]|uniref:eCIS core domain-containing protein n=1 Tax=Acidisoma cladoniae TaxID=3040935 RepID=UPI00254DB98F|nr:DUF4157 domain-containing protein [Acidisoma sp. PAMC 29798]
MPPQIRQALTGYILPEVMDRARFKVGDMGAINAAAVIQYLNHDVTAVTLVDLIVFRNPNDAYGNPALWAHELTHVKQFMDWGVENFGIRYARNPDDVENPAYAVQNGYAQWRIVQNQQGPYSSFPIQNAGTAAFACVTVYGVCRMQQPTIRGTQCGCIVQNGVIPGIAQ